MTTKNYLPEHLPALQVEEADVPLFGDLDNIGGGIGEKGWLVRR